jgi:DNA-binding CsgD family transcriptional regulator
MLAGFTGLVRSADNPAPLSRNELGLMRFMLSLWPDAITRLVDNQHQDDNSALLDMHGTVLYAGDSIRASLQAVFGVDGWQRNLSRTGLCAPSFQQAFQAVRDPEVIRPSAECRFPGLTGPAVLRFRRIGSCSLRRYFPERPQVEVRLVAGRNNQLPFDPSLCRRYALTQRETAIIAAIYRGASNTTIAQELGISVATVKHHVYNIFNKVGVDSRTQLLFALSIR